MLTGDEGATPVGDEEQRRPRRTRATVRREQQKSQTPNERTPSPGTSNQGMNGRETSPVEPIAKRSTLTDSLGHGGATTRSNVLPPYHEREIRKGALFQAQVVPIEEWVPALPMEQTDQSEEKEICVWAPDEGKLSDADLEEFCTMARAQYNYNAEQALGILHWHHYNVDKSLSDMGSYSPYAEEWPTEDKVLFEQAYINYGKNFAKIRQLIPHKPLSALVDYYYLWKKTRGYSSYMERDRDSDEYEEDGPKKAEKLCENCEQLVNKLTKSAGGMLCCACTIYYRRNGEHRPCAKRQEEAPTIGKGEKCPSGFEKSMDQFEIFAQRNSVKSGDESKASLRKGEEYIRKLDYRVHGSKTKAQRSSNEISQRYQRHLSVGIDQYRIPGRFKIRPNHRWTEDEKLLTVQAFRRYGKDFEAIAEMITTKSTEMIRDFYRENVTKYRLDYMIEQCEAEQKRVESEMDKKKQLAEEAKAAADVIEIN